MNWYNNLSVGKKIVLAFTILVASMISTAGISFLALNTLLVSNNRVSDSNILISKILEARRQEKNFLLRGLEKYGTDTKNSVDKWRDNMALIFSLTAEFSGEFNRPDYRRLISEIEEQGHRYEKAFLRYVEVYKKNTAEEAAQEKIMIESARRYQEKCTEFIDLQKTDMTITTKKTYLLMSGIIIVSLFFAIFAGALVYRSIVNPVKRMLVQVEHLARGNLTDRNELTCHDELSRLGKELNLSSDRLEEMVTNVILSSQSLSQSVDQISIGNQSLAQRTSEQAAALEEISSTIEETAAAINLNADNARKASAMSDSSAQLARNGAELVDDAVSSINEINETSTRIGDIITVINDISFQTNLLALNAAVEAARAGEQGRGFAVVAGEVRNLAQRSGTASKEIGVLIKESIDRITAGTGKANKSGDALREIVTSVNTVNGTVREIAAASAEQKQGIGQITIAVSRLDSMTQMNAALVEEIASASQDLSGESRELMELTKTFTVRNTDKQNLRIAVSEKQTHHPA